MNYKCSYLKPDEPKSIDNGTMDKKDAFEFFTNYNWTEELKRMNSLPDDKIHYSPSVKFEDLSSQKWIELSAVEEEDNYVFYIFYKRRKEVKKFFGLSTKMEDNYVSEILDVSTKKTLVILNQFFDEEWDRLEDKF